MRPLLLAAALAVPAASAAEDPLDIPAKALSADGLLRVGDMVLDPARLTQAKSPEDPKAERSKAATGFSNYRTEPWPRGELELVFSSRVPQHVRAAIVDACRQWAGYARISCAQGPDEPYAGGGARDRSGALYVHGGPAQGACFATVGWSRSAHYGGQMWMYDDCAGAALHETGHALALLHEHQRFDRDQFVEILWENIDEDFWYAFMPMGAMGLPIHPTGAHERLSQYDPWSIMHYDGWAFSKNGLPTIRLRADGVSAQGTAAPLGSQGRLTRLDGLTLGRVYGGGARLAADPDEPRRGLRPLR